MVAIRIKKIREYINDLAKFDFNKAIYTIKKSKVLLISQNL